MSHPPLWLTPFTIRDSVASAAERGTDVNLRTERATATAPVAVLGTIALSLSAAPAYADAAVTTDREPVMRALPTGVAPTAAKAEAATRPRTHTVVRGDTVSGIAARHGLRTADVLAWNDLGWKSIIRPGDVIRLSAPGSGDRRAAPSSASGSSASARSASTHVVSRGDTLWAIARSNGVSVSALMRANDLSAGAIIYPGEKLRIPGTGDSAPQKKASSTKKPSSASKRAQTSHKGSHAAPHVTLDREQIAGVKLIISVGRERGVPRKGIAIALATAMVESGIRNVDHGTYDSLGMFQQRPSTGWGTRAQVRDARRSAAAFFGGPRDPNGTATRGLLDIPGWRDMEFGAAAQAVQISAFPDRYALWEKQAYAWLKKHG